MSEFKVLIVDDSPFMRKVFSDVIDADGAFKVLATASDGQQAVEMALGLKPDIITMDLEMPRMNGLEALLRIMTVQATPVIMLSAVTDNGTRDTIKALQYGAVDFIRKPDGAVKLDIGQVREQLLEKLHIARETMNKKPFRFLPAVEEKAEPTQPPTRTSEPDASTATSLPDPENIPDQLPLVGNEGSAGKEKLKPIANDSLPRKPAKPDSPAKSMASGASSFQTDNRIKKTSTEGLGGEIDRPKTKPAERKIAGDKLPESRTAGLASGLKRPEPKGVPPAEVKRPLKNPVDAGKPEAAPTSPPATTQRPKTSTAFTHIVAIGTSTGGPRALHEVLTGIPGDFPAPILVVQHMPPKFTNSLAQRLDQFCSIHVREASDGETIETGTAYIAPGGRHMSLAKELSGKYRIRLSDEGPRSGHMPSVDVMFESLIGHSQLKRHVVLMTGMGSDGAKGMKALQADGALTTIAEAEQTCVVYGMPRSAVELGAVSHQLPLQEIASVLVQEVKFRK